MPRSVEITLGERVYEVRQLPVGLAKAWRVKFAQPIEQMVGALEFAGEALRAPLGSGAELGDVVGKFGSVLLSRVGKVALGSMDLLLEMIFAYAPEIRADEAYVLESAYDDQVASAFVEVLKLAYPFSAILQAARGGPGRAGTRKS